MRYLRLYLYFLRFSASRALEFRLDFYFRVLMDVVFYGVSLGFFTIIYRHTAALGGWSLDQIYLFVCAFLLVDAVYMAVFANNLWWLPFFVNKGDLDYYLVRPVSSLFFLSLRDFAANSFLNVGIAAGLVAWALARYPQPLGAMQILAYLAFLAVGVFLTYVVRMMFIIPVFWLHSTHGLVEISWALSRLGERPVAIYAPWLKWVLLTFLPMAFMASVPAEILFQGLQVRHLALAAGVVGGLFGFTVWFWRRGLAAYSSASS